MTAEQTMEKIKEVIANPQYPHDKVRLGLIWELLDSYGYFSHIKDPEAKSGLAIRIEAKKDPTLTR